MKCSECMYYECALRSPMGGCPTLENGPWNKDYQPSGFSKAEEAAKEYSKSLDAEIQSDSTACFEEVISAFKAGACFAVQQVLSLIESRIAEILGDAQPAPVLRMELQELIDKIKEESK